MTRPIQHFVVCAVFAVGVVLSQNVQQPRGVSGIGGGVVQPPRGVSGVGGGAIGGGNIFNCPQERGEFEFPNDCTRFYRCDGGVATVVTCQEQLIFNPQTGYCDWPHNVQNPNCAAAVSALSAQTTQICRINPGRNNESFLAAHPDLCNGYYTCGTSYLYAPCGFCGADQYFNEEARACRSFVETGQNRETVCAGKIFILPEEQVYRLIDGTCWPYSNIVNPFQPLIDAIRSGTAQGQRPTPGPQRPG